MSVANIPMTDLTLNLGRVGTQQTTARRSQALQSRWKLLTVAGISTAVLVSLAITGTYFDTVRTTKASEQKKCKTEIVKTAIEAFQRGFDYREQNPVNTTSVASPDNFSLFISLKEVGGDVQGEEAKSALAIFKEQYRLNDEQAMNVLTQLIEAAEASSANAAGEEGASQSA